MENQLERFLKENTADKSQTEGDWWFSHVRGRFEKGGNCWPSNAKLPLDVSGTYLKAVTEVEAAAAATLALGRVVSKVHLVSRTEPMVFPEWWSRSSRDSFLQEGIWLKLLSAMLIVQNFSLQLKHVHQDTVDKRMDNEMQKKLWDVLKTGVFTDLAGDLRGPLSFIHSNQHDKWFEKLIMRGLKQLIFYDCAYFLLGDKEGRKRIEAVSYLFPRAFFLGGDPMLVLVA